VKEPLHGLLGPLQPISAAAVGREHAGSPALLALCRAFLRPHPDALRSARSALLPSREVELSAFSAAVARAL